MQCYETIFVNLKQGVRAFQIKDARDQENIFPSLHYLAVQYFSSFFLSFYI